MKQALAKDTLRRLAQKTADKYIGRSGEHVGVQMSEKERRDLDRAFRYVKAKLPKGDPDLTIAILRIEAVLVRDHGVSRR